jgi:hypothetical protein
MFFADGPWRVWHGALITVAHFAAGDLFPCRSVYLGPIEVSRYHFCSFKSCKVAGFRGIMETPVHLAAESVICRSVYPPLEGQSCCGDFPFFARVLALSRQTRQSDHSNTDDPEGHIGRERLRGLGCLE